MNFGQNLYNWFLSNAQSLVLMAIVVIGIYLGFKREFSKLIGFLVVALVAVGLVFNASGVKDVKPMEECSVLIETTKSAEDKTSRWFDLPIDYELFRDLLGVEADSKDYQITDMKLPFAGDIVRTTSVRRLNKLYFAYMNLSPEVQQAYKELIPYCGGVEDLLQKSEEFLFYPECHNIMDVARYRLEHNIEFSALSEKGKKYFNLEAYAHELEEKGRYALCNNGMFKL